MVECHPHAQRRRRKEKEEEEDEEEEERGEGGGEEEKRRRRWTGGEGGGGGERGGGGGTGVEERGMDRFLRGERQMGGRGERRGMAVRKHCFSVLSHRHFALYLSFFTY